MGVGCCEQHKQSAMRTSFSIHPRRNRALARTSSVVDRLVHDQAGRMELDRRSTRRSNTSYVGHSASTLPKLNGPPSHYDCQSSSTPIGGKAKRAIDITIASLAIVLLAPLMLIIVAVIKLTMGGPTVFAHVRIGHNGKPFKCYKFRTMARDADAILCSYLASHPQAADEWRMAQKLRTDPRVTPLGHLLRKSSLDELPQLINVLRGDMSCVGPRPIVADELHRYGIHSEEYFRVRPGLTGMWQISGRNRLAYDQRVALDCYYVRTWSLRTDLAIMAKTLFVLVNFDETS